MELSYLEMLTPRDIWGLAQNKPSLIADDLECFGIAPEITYSILLGRGVFKWLAARRDIIKLKDDWRDRLTMLYRSVCNVPRNSPEHRELVGQIHALEECRAQIRAVCHSERWRAPDYDSGAARFLASIGGTDGPPRSDNDSPE